MGKLKKTDFKVNRNQPLARQIEEDGIAKPTHRVKSRSSRHAEDEQFVDDKSSRKILESAREQQQELEDEHGSTSQKRPKKVNLSTGQGGESDSDDDDVPTEADGFDESIYQDMMITQQDEKALEMFMSKEAPQRKTLGDYIAEKLKEKEQAIDTHFSDIGSVRYQDLDPRVVELYTGVRQVLSRYRSGKLPKAFKIIPALSNWEQVLDITSPDTWTAAAMFAAARIFSVNLKEKMAQRFFNLILLPRVRDDICEYKRLNFHLYQALRKALFKPGAFFKGIVLPLCEGGDCTLREAMIIGSVLHQNHVPILHSCAAMLKIAEMEYSGTNSIFLNILMNKKYALPYRVVDGLVNHFVRFIADKRELPVLWHQALLVLVRDYNADLSSEQKEAILELLKVHVHHSMTAVIRTHLFNSVPRDQEMAPEQEPDNV
ncbi:Bystin [Halotydeus destructor]|nr:Bystin [Halotydeus destructor]